MASTTKMISLRWEQPRDIQMNVLFWISTLCSDSLTLRLVQKYQNPVRNSLSSCRCHSVYYPLKTFSLKQWIFHWSNKSGHSLLMRDCSLEAEIDRNECESISDWKVEDCVHLALISDPSVNIVCRRLWRSSTEWLVQVKDIGEKVWRHLQNEWHLRDARLSSATDLIMRIISRGHWATWGLITAMQVYKRDLLQWET